MPETGDVTRLLAELSGDGNDAIDRVFPLVYEELQGVAHRQMRLERADHTLNTTALVHEAYVRLAGAERIEWKSRAHFFAVAARAMRRILINHAESRNTRKRGGEWQRVELGTNDAVQQDADITLLDLDHALTRLASLDERQCRIVECRYFAGMSIEETAAGLDISVATVKRDWQMARAWLNRELTG
ncbi:MAG TPA: sigma-70 family RNA polymerase sigma factor [Longimicrobiales bacterium]|nr:sigma-70 family RNA polymerase sigma factor [Longimicrobiales bacterium]